MKRVFLFIIAGGIGFIIDSGVFIYLYYIESIGISSSRILSFFTAVFFTWLLNRRYTFNTEKNKTRKEKTKEYLLYFKAQSIGAVINFAIFFTLVYSLNTFKQMPILALATGSITAMFYNYFMSKRILS